MRLTRTLRTTYVEQTSKLCLCINALVLEWQLSGRCLYPVCVCVLQTTDLARKRERRDDGPEKCVAMLH